MFKVALGSVEGRLVEFFFSSILILLSFNYRIFLSYSYCLSCIRWIMSSCRFIFSLLSCYISSRVLYAPLFGAKFLIELIFGSFFFTDLTLSSIYDFLAISTLLALLSTGPVGISPPTTPYPHPSTGAANAIFSCSIHLKLIFLTVLTPPLSGVFYLGSTLVGLSYQKESFDWF